MTYTEELLSQHKATNEHFATNADLERASNDLKGSLPELTRKLAGMLVAEDAGVIFASRYLPS